MPERTVLLSPLDIDDVSDIRFVGAKRKEARRVWLEAPGFGEYLRERRESLNLSLRRAGSRIGISHTYLALIEQGGGQYPLPMELYERMAETYEVDVREVLDRAGCRYAVVEEVAERLRDLERLRFERILLHPNLKPPEFTAQHLVLFPEAVRKYVIELAQAVDANARAHGPRIVDIMDGEDER